MSLFHHGKSFSTKGSLLSKFVGALLILLSPLALPAVIRDGGVDPSNLGQGGWLYIMKDATNQLGGHIPSVTNENSLFAYLKGVGFNYVIVKAGTSNTLWNGNYTFPQFTSNLVNSAHAHGLLIFGSNRSWGNDNPGEVAIADYIFNTGADGYIWDAESEWEASNAWITNGPAQAWNLCMTIRSHWTNKFLAHNPFDTLYLHSSFPYREFGYWSDAVMPQVYHHSATQGNAIAAIHWTDVNYQKFQNSLAGMGTSANYFGSGINATWTNAIKPLVLMRDVYGAGFSPTYPPQDVQNFLDYMVADPNCVTSGGYQGSDYFRSELHDTNQWAYMKASTIGLFSNVVNNIVIDDPTATKNGSWTAVKTIDATTGSTVTFSGATGTDTNSFGTNYLTKTQGTGLAYVQFTPNVLTAGDYDLYQWHPSRSNASASVPFIVVCNSGTNTLYANQQTNAGNWSILGRCNFAGGTNGYIRVTDAIAESNAIAMVDGLKMVYVVTTNPPPVPFTFTNVSASPRQNGAIITWSTSSNATTQVLYGLATNNYSSTALDVTLLTNHMVWLAGLASNTTYYYRVLATIGTNQFVSPDFTFFTDPSLIVDSSKAAFSGVWTISSAAPDKYSAYYKYAATAAGSDSAQATFRPTITLPGNYDLYVWYSQGTNRSGNVPLAVSYPGGSFLTNIDMTTNGGGWRLLLTNQSFSAGTNGFVRIGNGSGESGKVVIADAVRWTYTPGQDVNSAGAAPAWWLNYYFGANANTNTDADGDGYSAFAEYVLGTDPTAAGSQLKIQTESLVGGGLSVSFTPFQAGRVYQIQSSSSLSDGAPWTTLSNLPVAINTNGQGMITVTNLTGTQQFLRLSVHLSP